MRSQIYRNLDTPFEIFGFSPGEVIALIITFVLSGELAQSAGLHRLWACLAVVLAATLIHIFRRTMGARFFRRILRFLLLPAALPRKLYERGGRI